jgi:hypothetical protein
MLGEMKKLSRLDSDSGGLMADLLEASRRRNLSAYERTWKGFLAWAAAGSFDPRSAFFSCPCLRKG